VSKSSSPIFARAVFRTRQESAIKASQAQEQTITLQRTPQNSFKTRLPITPENRNWFRGQSHRYTKRHNRWLSKIKELSFPPKQWVAIIHRYYSGSRESEQIKSNHISKCSSKTKTRTILVSKSSFPMMMCLFHSSKQNHQSSIPPTTRIPFQISENT
jgi:hypothetical protein